MAVIDVTDEWAELTDGDETTDTLVVIGKGMRVATGDTTGRTYDNATSFSFRQVVIVPAGVIMSAICPADKTSTAMVEYGFSA